MVYFDKKNSRLIFIEKSPTSAFWDKLWTKHDLEKLFTKKRIDLLVLPTTRKYLKKGSKILEGGCGHGSFVYHLNKAGYKCIGVDFAKKTISRVNKFLPDLPIHYGDVTKLKYKSNSFDGYWSLGVIEHFYQGYEPILKEIKRVVKKKGFVFITFPYFSPLRRYKANRGSYPQVNFRRSPKEFYQFALNDQKVISDLEKLGFELVEKKPFDGFAGLRKETPSLSFIWKPLTDWSEKNYFVAGIRFIVSKVVERWTSHSILLVLQKR
jgi:ubiquinone/menaquinone biosynthesis C-methylase UbiE